jgi:hypothetical protein
MKAEKCIKRKKQHETPNLFILAGLIVDVWYNTLFFTKPLIFRFSSI